MKVIKILTMPVILVSILLGNVYAATPAYMKFSFLNALENGFYSFFKTIYYMVMFALILATAYFVTKFLAKKGMVQGKSKSMKLLESMPLGADKNLHLVKVGAQYFLIGSASKSMFKISEIEKDKLFEEQQESLTNGNEFEYLSYEDSIESKDFNSYLGSVKSNLYKLKSMVRGNNSDEIK